MRKNVWFRAAALALVSLLLCAGVTYANARTWRFVYYSDATFTTIVGMELWPAVCCDPSYAQQEGSTSDYRKKYVYFDEWDCEGNGQASVICQQYINGAWYSVTCP